METSLPIISCVESPLLYGDVCIDSLVLVTPESEPFCSRSDGGRKTARRWLMSYQLPSEATFQAIQLLLYVLSFATVILIFIYIAYERPEEREKKKEKTEE